MGRIIVIDGNVEERETSCAILSYAGHEVRSAENGRDAIRKCQAGETDLIITYIDGNRRNGLQAISQLHLEFPEVKIIAVQNSLSERPEEFSLLAKTVGASRIIAKPFGWEQMLRAIRESIGE